MGGERGTAQVCSYTHADDQHEHGVKHTLTYVKYLTTGPGVRFGSPRPETRGGGEGGGHIPYRNCMLTMVLRDSLGEQQMSITTCTLLLVDCNVSYYWYICYDSNNFYVLTYHCTSATVS